MIEAMKQLRQFLRNAGIPPGCVRVTVEVDCGVAGTFRHHVAREWEGLRWEPPAAVPAQIPDQGSVLGIMYVIKDRYD